MMFVKFRGDIKVSCRVTKLCVSTECKVLFCVTVLDLFGMLGLLWSAVCARQYVGLSYLPALSLSIYSWMLSLPCDRRCLEANWRWTACTHCLCSLDSWSSIRQRCLPGTYRKRLKVGTHVAAVFCTYFLFYLCLILLLRRICHFMYSKCYTSLWSEEIGLNIKTGCGCQYLPIVWLLCSSRL